MDMVGQRLPRRYGDYILLRRIAKGGMGEIFLAELQGAGGFRRDVIVKQLLSQFSRNSEFINMLFDEARIAARLVHPNICQVINCGEFAGTGYLVLEYVHGQSLRRLLRRLSERAEELSFDEAIYILLGVLSALQYAHTKLDDDEQPMGIIHRDVTPENILLSYGGEVKLTDFGVAKATGRTENTRAGTIKGKLAYLSPEQVRDQPCDHRVDQYMLGLTICEVLSGVRVFDATTDAKIINQVLDGAAYRVSRRPEIMERLGSAGEMVMRSLQYSADERFESCAQMAEEAAALTTPAALAAARQSLAKRMFELFQEERAQERAEMAAARAQAEQDGTLVTQPDDAEHTFTTLDPRPPSMMVSGVVAADDSITPPPASPPLSAGAKKAARDAAPLGWMLRGGAVVALLFLGVVLYVTHGEPPRSTVIVEVPTAVATNMEPAPTPTPTAAPSPTPPTLPPSVSPPRPIISSAQPAPSNPPEAPPEPAPRSHPLRHMEPKPASAPKAAALPHRHTAPRPPPEPASGTLDVACLPWCDILLNGQSLHKTSPLRNFKLSAGEYELRVVNPPSGQAESRHLSVHPGEHMQMQFRLLGDGVH